MLRKIARILTPTQLKAFALVGVLCRPFRRVTPKSTTSRACLAEVDTKTPREVGRLTHQGVAERKRE